jgi:hypothetical protein
MKTNKKAILGMLVAMIMSLGVMGGINSKTNDSNLQLISMGCASNAMVSEGSESVGWTTGSLVFGSLASQFYTSGIVSAATGVGAPVAIANGILGVMCTL